MDERDTREEPVFEPSGDMDMEMYSGRAGGADAGIDEIEDVLREIAQCEVVVSEPAAEAVMEPVSRIPEEIPLAEEVQEEVRVQADEAVEVQADEPAAEMFPPSATDVACCAEDETPDGAPVFENPIDYADVPVTPEPQPEPAVEESVVPTYDIAIAEPMTAHDASIVALGDNVRQVTHLIESVGRTLEAQNQRSLRLMERLEAVARALECLPEEADRGLEGLDAVGEAIKEGTAPLREINERLGNLPDVVRAVRETNDSTRELWSVATRAMAGRLAFSAVEERQRERREASRRRWRVLASSALAVAAFIGGSLLSGSDLGDRARVALGTAILGDHAASADEGDAHWRVIRVRPAPPLEAPKPAQAAKIQAPESMGVDEESPSGE
jgi:hypothetical protein